jgi:cytidyltransferase-like protein
LKRGLVIGKFYPPHRGHKFLIDTALRQVDHLDVIICVRPDQTIPGSMRGSWLRAMHPSANVVEVADPGHDNDSHFWAEYTRKILGYAPDAVFTSEDYGDEYARFLGSIHIKVDPERRQVPISGTKISRGNRKRESLLPKTTAMSTRVFWEVFISRSTLNGVRFRFRELRSDRIP